MSCGIGGARPEAGRLGAVTVANTSAYIYGMVEGRFRSTATAFAAGDYIALWWVKAIGA